MLLGTPSCHPRTPRHRPPWPVLFLRQQAINPGTFEEVPALAAATAQADLRLTGQGMSLISALGTLPAAAAGQNRQIAVFGRGAFSQSHYYGTLARGIDVIDWDSCTRNRCL
mgnify:CR=1 FL=1